jgi:hypothetical protein
MLRGICTVQLQRTLSKVLLYTCLALWLFVSILLFFLFLLFPFQHHEMISRGVNLLFSSGQKECLRVVEHLHLYRTHLDKLECIHVLFRRQVYTS